MAGNKVKYSDLIQDDGALDRLLDKLEQTATTFEGLVSTAKSSARDISNSLNSMSSATQAGRDSILAANAAVANLKSATAQLKVSISDTSQAVTGLKAAISENTTVTAKSYSAIEQAIGKYDKLKSDLQDYMNLYKSLTTQEKSSPFGQQTLEEITKLASRVNTLTANLRALTKTQKERLSIDEQETNSLRKLTDAQSKANVERHINNQALREANRIAALNAKLRKAEPGSYQAISAQYALNKIELSKLNTESKTATEYTRKLVADTYLLYQQMKQFQEATGVHTLSVGNYTKVWDGLGYSVAQVVREIPNAAIDMRTFFIAISNNLPILADQIMQVRKENEALRAQGAPTVSAIKRVGRALMSWNTILTVVLTVLNLFGDEIIKWVGSLFKGEAAVMSMRKAIKALNKELDSGANGYGANIVAFKKLRDAYVSLNSELEKTEFLEKYKDEMEDLGLAANSVNEADQLFIERTKEVVEAYKNRAKAAAAKSLAEAKYEEMFKKERELEQAQNGPVTLGDVLAAGATSFSAKGRDVGAEAENARLARVERLRTEVAALSKDAESFYKMYDEYTSLANTVLAEEGSDPEGRDLTDRIYRARLEARKKYEKAETALIKDEYARREWELKDQAQAEIEALEETRRKAIEWRDDPGNNYEELTAEEQAAIQEILEKTSVNIIDIREKLNEDLRLLTIDQQISELKLQEETDKLMQQTVKKGSDKEYELRKESIERQKQMALLENSKLEESVQQREADIIAKYDKMLEDLVNERNIALKEVAINGIELQLQAVKAGSDEEYKLQLELLNKQEALEKEKNKMLDESLRVEEGLITNSYERRRKLLQGQYELANFMQKQATAKAQYMAGAKSAGTGLFVTERPSGKAKKLGLVRDTGIGSKFASEYQLEAFEIEQQIAALEYQIEQAGKGLNDWSTGKIDEANAQIEVLKEELKGVTDIMSLIAKEGIGGGILASLGFDKDSISALQDAGSIIIDQIQAIAQAEVEAAEKAAEAAQERVDAAKSAYDAEIEARNNGYANNVATAKAELEQEKKKQKEKQKMLEAAQKTQARIDSAMQMSSLVTATANLWASYSKLGPLGQALTIAAIAAMWGSFGAAKLKAKNVTSQEYGEGGLEFLEGGSHASGNDIDLGTVNSRGRRMRAEGGEAMAIINKKNTRKYKALLPGIVDSLNAGNFEDKYLSSLNTSGISLSMNSTSIDISKIEDDVADIRKQNETKYYTADGYLIIQRKNVKRIIKN